MHVGRTHARHILSGQDAGFGHQQPVGRHLVEQTQRGVQRHRKAAQVAVVDAQQRRLQLQRAVQLGAVMHLDQHAHAVRERHRLQIGHLRVVQAGGDQQDAVRAHRARLKDLVLVDHEVLAQHRQRAGGTRLLQILGAALEVLQVGQHAQAGRAVARVARGDLGRAEVGADHALARAGLLDLGDHRGPAGGDLGAQRGLEAAQVGGTGLGLGAHGGERLRGAGRGHLLMLGDDDAGEDVGGVRVHG